MRGAFYGQFVNWCFCFRLWSRPERTLTLFLLTPIFYLRCTYNTCHIVSIYHAIYRIDISCDISHDIGIEISRTYSRYWYRYDTICKYAPQVDYHKVWRVRSGQDPRLKQKHQYTNWPQKAPRSLRAAHYTGRLHECAPVRRKETPGKETLFWTCEMQFLAIRTKARTVVGKREECVPCDPG